MICKYTYWTREGQFETYDMHDLPMEELHKTNGPALKYYFFSSINTILREEYYISGVDFTEREFKKLLRICKNIPEKVSLDLKMILYIL